MSNTTGNCFEIAAHIALAEGRFSDWPDEVDTAVRQMRGMGLCDIKLVHGMVSRPTDDLRHPHAWVEGRMKVSGNDMMFCVDFSNGHDCIHPRSLYYKLGRVRKDQLVRYTPKSVRARLVGEMHYGPWDLENYYTPEYLALTGHTKEDHPNGN